MNTASICRSLFSIACLSLVGTWPLLAQGDVKPANSGRHKPALTHLNVPVGQIVFLSTMCVAPTNVRRPFFYDRSESLPFAVPNGFSFVITDLILEHCSVDPETTNQQTLAILDIGHGSRFFSAGFLGAETKHYPFAGGLVVPEGTEVAGRVVGGRDTAHLASTAIEFKVLGYFVQGHGLAENEPFAAP